MADSTSLETFLSENKAQIAIAVGLGLVSIVALKRFMKKEKRNVKYPIEIDFSDKRVQEKLGRNLKEFLSNLAGKNQEQVLLDLQKLYPNECSVKLGNSQPIVFLNSFESFRKFNLKVSSLEPIASRPKNPVFGVVSKNYLGSFFRLYDDRMKEMRKSTLNGLHKLTANAVEFEAKLTDELEYFMEFLNSNHGQLNSAPVHLQQISTNMIVTIGIDARFPYDNDLNTAVKGQINNMTEILTAVDMVNISNLSDGSAFKPLEPKLNSIYDFLTGALNGYKSGYDKDIIRTYGDYALSKQEELKQIKKLNPEDIYSDEDILVQFFTLLMAGAATTGLTLSWAFYYLGKHPEVQSKIYEEMSHTVGTGSLIGYTKHHTHLKYTEGVVNEILRLSSTQPLIPRATVPNESGQVTVGDYTLPSNTPVLINAFAMHRDAAYWKETAAERFEPSRWINDRGELISFRDSYIPFGVGPRSCLGDSLSRMILFLLVANLVQRFEISLIDEKDSAATNSKIGVMRRTNNYNLKFVARK